MHHHTQCHTFTPTPNIQRVELHVAYFDIEISTYIPARCYDVLEMNFRSKSNTFHCGRGENLRSITVLQLVLTHHSIRHSQHLRTTSSSPPPSLQHYYRHQFRHHHHYHHYHHHYHHHLHYHANQHHHYHCHNHHHYYHHYHYHAHHHH